MVRLEDRIRIDNIREGGSIGNTYGWKNIRLKLFRNLEKKKCRSYSKNNKPNGW